MTTLFRIGLLITFLGGEETVPTALSLRINIE